MSEHPELNHKSYTRFNKEENIFEDIILTGEHQERFKRVAEEYELEVSRGDLVRVRDGSGNLDFDTGIKRPGIDPLFMKNPALVIETGLSFITEPLSCLGEKSRYVLDLLLGFPNGEKVYTSTTFVVSAKDWEWTYEIAWQKII
jgi:hypothetical protein